MVSPFSSSAIIRADRWWPAWMWGLIRFGLPILIVWALLGVYVPILAAEIKYQAATTKENFEAVFPRGMLMPHWTWETIPGWVTGYALEIPKLGIREPVIEGVDAGNKDRYMEALTRGVAHADKSGLPDKPGVQYYFAHSSGLPFWGGRAVTFATLYKLEAGDEVIVYRENKPHHYRVVDKIIVKPDNVSLLSTTDHKERVVLQTCWPLGTNWQRLLIIAEPS